MTRVLRIVAAALVVALALAPGSADAQVIAGAGYQCVVSQDTPAGGGIYFQPDIGSVTFGSAISTAGSQFNSFILTQAGIYQIDLSGSLFFAGQFGTPLIYALLNGSGPAAQWTAAPITGLYSFGGAVLISVAAANSVLSLTSNDEIRPQDAHDSCKLVITLVAYPPPPPPPPAGPPVPPLTSAPGIMKWRRVGN